MVGGIATAAAARTFPFRVFSFPSEVKLPSSRLVELSLELLEDSRFDLENFLRGELSRRLAARLDEDMRPWFTGDGSVQPLGLLSGFTEN
jgi:hypothetical protein